MNIREFEKIFRKDIAPIYIEHQNSFDEYGIHGCLHIARSLIISRALANKLISLGFNIDIDKISYAVSFHDSGRKANLKDYWESESRNNCYNYLINKGYSEEYAVYVSNLILKDAPIKDYNFFCVYDTDVLEIIRPSTGIGIFNFNKSYLRCNHILSDYDSFINEIIPFINETEYDKHLYSDENALQKCIALIELNKNSYPTLYAAATT